jgi:hypothetical protein
MYWSRNIQEAAEDANREERHKKHEAAWYDGHRIGFNAAIEEAARLLDQEAYHSAYAAELASVIRSLRKK